MTDRVTEDLAMIARNAINYIIQLERERSELLEALHKLCEAADESDDVRYGTLSTSFVRDIAYAAIKAVEGEKA